LEERFSFWICKCTSETRTRRCGSKLVTELLLLSFSHQVSCLRTNLWSRGIRAHRRSGSTSSVTLAGYVLIQCTLIGSTTGLAVEGNKLAATFLEWDLEGTFGGCSLCTDA